MKKNNKKGFTIVELVIVIAVIGILSAILIPTFVGVTKAANEAALKSNLANAYSMYAADAADGKVDGASTPTELKFYAQADILLKNSAGEYFEYDEANGGWQVTPYSGTVTIDDTASPAANTYKTVGGQTGGYNGFTVFADNAAKSAN